MHIGQVSGHIAEESWWVRDSKQGDPIAAVVGHSDDSAVAGEPQAGREAQLSTSASCPEEAHIRQQAKCYPAVLRALKQPHRAGSTPPLQALTAASDLQAATPRGPAIVPGGATYPAWARVGTSMACTAS